MLKFEPNQFNFYLVLYHKISEIHILKLINFAISFQFVNKFVNKLLKNSYCKGFEVILETVLLSQNRHLVATEDYIRI